MSNSHNVARYLPLAATERPEQAAIRIPHVRNNVFHWEEITFAELNRDTDALAFEFKSKGIVEGTKVLLMVKPGHSLIQICFTLFKIGAVPVVIDPGMGLKSFLNCVRHTQPKGLIGIPLAHWIALIFRNAFSSVRIRIKVNRFFQRRIRKDQNESYPIPQSGASTLAAILFTSGSTGKPKGVRYQHGQFQAQVDLIRESFSIMPGEIDLPLLPVFALFNSALGMTTVVPEIDPAQPAKVDPALLVRTIQEGNVTNTFGSPAIWSKVAAYCELMDQQMPSVKRILMAGAPVSPQLFKRLKPFFPNAKLYSPYGATECLPVSLIESNDAIQSTAKMTAKGSGTCVGFPVTGVSVKIIKIFSDTILTWDCIDEMATGQIGEILVTGPSVTHSYYRLPEATEKSKILDDDGRIWHRMGDAGFIDEMGRLWFCGRIVERVITQDKIYYTDCCEGIFLQDESVHRCALIGLGDAPNQTPAIVIEGISPNKELIVKLKERAHAHVVTCGIEHFYFMKSFPVDVRHNAKIHRLEIAKKLSK